MSKPSDKLLRRIVFLALTALLLFMVFILPYDFWSNQPADLMASAEQVMQSCGTSASRQRCYDVEIPKLMDKITMEQAFEVVKLIQAKDNGYWFCHAAGHNISAREYQKNPDNWREIITRCEIGLCSNGCLHGALQEHFSSESLNKVQLTELMPDLQMICEARSNWQPTLKQQSSCYHELGHLSLYLTDADILGAASICETVAVRPDRSHLQTCQEGIFMQIFEPREPEDFSLIYGLVPLKDKLKACEGVEVGVQRGACWKAGWKGQTTAFCNQFEKGLRGACFREAWVVDDEQIETAEGIVNYCSYAEDAEERTKCYNKLFFGLMSKFEFDQTRVIAICETLPQSLMGQCFANTASRLIETDKRLIADSVAVCKLAEEHKIAEPCYKELLHYSRFLFHPDSAEFRQLCSSLPEEWSIKCFNRETVKY